MNAKELRIGNWVGVGYPKQFELSDFEDYFGEWKKDENDTVEPIPLTPEIFQKIKEANGEDFCYNWSTNFGLYWPEWDDIYLPHIQHVHQFQNFYYMAENKELVVEL